MTLRPLRIKRWVWWILTIFLLLIASPLLFKLLAMATWYFGTRPNGNKLYQSAFINPINDVRSLRSGGFAFQGWEVWLTFTTEKDIQLNHQQTFQLLSLGDAQDKLADSVKDHCKTFMEKSEAQHLEFFYKTDASAGVPNGQFLAHDKIVHTYCYQDWMRN